MFTSIKNKTILSLTLLSCLTSVAIAAPSESLKTKMAAIGNVKEVRETDSKGIYAWYLEKNGKTLVLYTTPDEKSFIKGTIYNVSDKKVVSDKYAIESLKYASEDFKNKTLSTNNKTFSASNQGEVKLSKSEDIAFKIGYMNVKWDKPEIPEAIRLLDSLAGAKEGSGKPQDTLYIIYDPRCPWCHRTFDATREYVKKGYTIKWLPTVALGKVTDEVISLAAAPLQNPKSLSDSFAKKDELKKLKVSDKNKADLEQNLQFLYAYFKKVKPSENPSVPIGIFLDKTTGKITDLQGLNEKPTLELLFGGSR